MVGEYPPAQTVDTETSAEPLSRAKHPRLQNINNNAARKGITCPIQAFWARIYLKRLSFTKYVTFFTDHVKFK